MNYIHCLEKINEFYLKAFNPQKLSIKGFDLVDYLDYIILQIGKIFEIPLIIIRDEYELDPNRLKVLACYGAYQRTYMCQ